MIEILEEPEVRERLHPITVETYHAMGEMGLVDAKVELLNGAIVEKMSKSPLHTFLTEKLIEFISEHLPKQFKCRFEQPLTLPLSEPEPDLAVVDRTSDNYLSGHPTTAHLVIEVAVSSQKIDREKANIYASAGIADYWLIDATAQQVEVFSNPTEGVYQSKTIVKNDDMLRSSVISEIELTVSEIFPATS